MDQKTQSAAANRVYKDFEPFFEWIEDAGSATLVLMLPGFTTEQLKVQVTSTAILKINGERQMIQNTWRRFSKEFSIPSYCDTNEVSAKFEHGVLSVKFPKLITPAKPQEQETITEMPQQQQEAITEMPQQQQEAITEMPQQQQEAITEMPPQQESPPKQEPNNDEKEKNKIQEQVAHEKKVGTNNGILETTQKFVNTTKAKGKQQQAKMIQRLKTRMLDFNISFRSEEDNNNNKDVKQGLIGGGTRPMRRKIFMNMIVVILMFLVLGVYVKNAIWSSSPSSSKGESNFQEF